MAKHPTVDQWGGTDDFIMEAVYYMYNAAMSRRLRHLDLPFFTYCLLRSGVNRFSKVFASSDVEAAAVALLDSCEKPEEASSDEPVPIEEITVSAEVREVLGTAQGKRGNVDIYDLLSHIIGADKSIASILSERGISITKLRRHITKRQRPVQGGAPATTHNDPVPYGAKPNKPVADSDVEGLCTDLTELARMGRVGQVFCREKEIDRIVISLLRRNKNNPLLVGDPGVGKTAIVEGLAKRIAEGNVPERLRGNSVLSLSMASMVGGTLYRGQFEEKMEKLLKHVSESKRVILFIDEVHTIVGAGDTRGNLDASNILKPYLARGDIRCVGATTEQDYNRSIRRDGALDRRFQKIAVEEPDEEMTTEILERLLPTLEEHHGCRVEPEAIGRVLSLCRRFLSERRFPDKAIDCLDEACARASVSEGVSVDAALVEEAVASLVSIPVSMVRLDDQERVAAMKDALALVAPGNASAAVSLCEHLCWAYSRKRERSAPLAVLGICGPEGVGKRAAARLAAEYLCGKNGLIELNGADFHEVHSTSRIIGAPAGYVGYEDGGSLVRQIRQRPFSFLVIDEVPMMAPAVCEIFARIVERGVLADRDGIDADFRNVVVIFVHDVTPSKGIGFGSSTGGIDFSNLPPIFSKADATVEFGAVSAAVLVDIVERELENVLSACAPAGSDVESNVASQFVASQRIASPEVARRLCSRMAEEAIVASAGEGPGHFVCKNGKIEFVRT